MSGVLDVICDEVASVGYVNSRALELKLIHSIPADAFSEAVASGYAVYCEGVNDANTKY